MTESQLFTPVTLGPLTLRNRACLSATWMGRGDPVTGEPLPSLVAHYASIAKNECGLLIVEHTAISEEGLAHETMLRLYDDAHIASHRRIASAVHATPGAKIIVQLNNAGAYSISPNRYSPSGLPEGKAMTPELIEKVKSDFVAAAKRAKEAGYDGVQIHSAHGYLLSQFLSPKTNARTDEYGGASIEGRARLVLEVCRAVREAMGRDFAVAMKINCNDFAGDDGLKPEETGWICKQLEGVLDFVELSGGTPFGKYQANRVGLFHKDPMKELWYADELATISAMTKMPLCIVGAVRSPAGAERAFKAGATLVSLARPFIRHKDIIRHWHEGTPYTPCVSCSLCFRNSLGPEHVKCWVKYGEGETNFYEENPL